MILGLVIVILMLVVNAIFSAYEMALATISRGHIMMMVNAKRKGANETFFMKDRMEGSLAVIQLGITLAGAIAAAAGGVGVDNYLSPWFQENWYLSAFASDTIALMCLIIPLTCLTIIFAELIPKTYAIRHHEQVCLLLSPFMKILALLTYPLISVLEKIVKRAMELVSHTKIELNPIEAGMHEFKAAVAIARTSRLVGASQEKILISAAQLSIRQVKEVMIPIKDVSMIPVSDTLSQALIRAHLDMHTRFPVCAREDDPQTIEGYLNFKDIMSSLKLNPDNPSIKGIVRSIKRFAETTFLSQALEQMVAERLHIALVISPDGKVTGMISLEDIIEELVGEIEDEFDRIPTYIHPYGNGGGWVMGGGVTMAVVAQTTGMSLNLSPQTEKLKLADWFALQVDTILKGGEVLKVHGLQFTARKLRRKKLAEAAIIPAN